MEKTPKHIHGFVGDYAGPKSSLSKGDRGDGSGERTLAVSSPQYPQPGHSSRCGPPVLPPSGSDMDGLDFDDEDEDEDDEDANDEYDDAIEDGIANKKGVVSWHTDYRDGGVVIRDEFRSSNEDGGLMDMPGNRRSARLGKDRGNVSAAVLTAPAASTKLADSAIIGGSARASSPRSARRLRNRLAAARMRTRQKQHLVELEKRKEELERRAAELEGELRLVQRKNNPLNASIDKLAEMIDDLTKVESTMLHGIDECKGLLQSLEVLYESRKQQQRD